MSEDVKKDVKKITPEELEDVQKFVLNIKK